MSREYVCDTRDFFWGGYKEFIIEENDFKVYNQNTGIQSSTFTLKQGHYSITIAPFDMGYTNHSHTLIGTPKLSGTEEDNKWLEDTQMSSPHIREYILSGDKINISITKNYLLKEDLLNKELYVYINKLT